MSRPAGRQMARSAAAIGIAIALAVPAGAAGAVADAAGTPDHKAARHHASAKRPARRGDGVLLLADCFGRFIAWRDEMSSLMLQANSYTPTADDRSRFDRMEQAFADGVLRERNLVLTMQPAFREADFPADIRKAFRAGLKTGSAAFAANAYRNSQIAVLGQDGLTPPMRMTQLEANADAVFGPLSASCGP